MAKMRGRSDEPPVMAPKRARVSVPPSHISFVEPFKGVTLEQSDEEWVSSLGLAKLLNIMRDGDSLVEFNSLYKEFVQEFRILNEGPTPQYQTTIHEGARVREIAIDAKTFAAQFEIPHNPDGMQLGGRREAKWVEGYKFFEDDKRAYDSKKGWRLEKLKPEYLHLKKKYELLHRLIWFRKRSDYVGNGQARTIHDVCKSNDPLRHPDWATALLRNFAQEVRNIQSIAERGSRQDQVTFIGPIIRQILYSKRCDNKKTPIKDPDEGDDLMERCQDDLEPDNNEEAVSRDVAQQVQNNDAEGSLSPERFESHPRRDSAEQFIGTAGRDTYSAEMEAFQNKEIFFKDAEVDLGGNASDMHHADSNRRFERLRRMDSASELRVDVMAPGFQEFKANWQTRNPEPDSKRVAGDDIYEHLRIFNELTEHVTTVYSRTSAMTFLPRLKEYNGDSACVNAAHKTCQAQDIMLLSDRGNTWSPSFVSPSLGVARHSASTGEMAFSSRASATPASIPTPSIPNASGAVTQLVPAVLAGGGLNCLQSVATPRETILRQELPQARKASLVRFFQNLKNRHRYKAEDLGSSPSHWAGTPKQYKSAEHL